MQQATLDDDSLLDLVQRQTLRYFWDFAHPVSGLARERSDVTPGCGPDVVTTGGTGFGIMAIVAGVERGWLDRADAAARLLDMAHFLGGADRYHGVFPHWLDGSTGRTVAFSEFDDGADLVRPRSCSWASWPPRQYFAGTGGTERELRERVEALWNEAEFDWHTKGGEDVSTGTGASGTAGHEPSVGAGTNAVTHVLAASSRRHAIRPRSYHRGWAGGPHFANGHTYHGVRLPLGPAYGGPLFAITASWASTARSRAVTPTISSRTWRTRASTSATAPPARTATRTPRQCWGLT